VLGYFALAPHLIEREDLRRRVGRGAPRQVPAILLAKLALHTRLQGQGLGRELLIWALSTVVDAARVAGGKVVVVDAIDDAAAAFYEAHDFSTVPHNPRRLVMKLSTAAKALGLSWP
jgi:predicted N-acetyltransferase YhbS